MHLPDFVLLVIGTLSAIAAGLAMLASNYRVARVLFWIAALAFGSLGVVWSATSEGYSLVTQMIVSAVVGAIAAAGLTWTLWEIRQKEKAEVTTPAEVAASPTPTAAIAARKPTLEATNRSVIDATGGQFPSEMPFPFAKADNDSFINMPGIKVEKNSDGTMSISSAPVTQQFPSPTGEFSKLSKQELRDEVSKTSSELRIFDKKRDEAFHSVLAKYSSNDFSKNPHPAGLDEDWKALTEKQQPESDRFAKLALSLASECMARIGSLDGSTLSRPAQSGAGGVLHAKFAGPHPALEAAEFLDELSQRLH